MSDTDTAKHTSKQVNSKSSKMNDFSPFENFLMNLLQKDSPYGPPGLDKAATQQMNNSYLGQQSLATAGSRMSNDPQSTGRPNIRLNKR